MQLTHRFAKLANDLAESAPRFREWFDASSPELEKLPLDWRELDKRPFLKLLVVKCLRPDRMTQVRGASTVNRSTEALRTFNAMPCCIFFASKDKNDDIFSWALFETSFSLRLCFSVGAKTTAKPRTGVVRGGRLFCD